MPGQKATEVARREQILNNLLRLQTHRWGLLVADPAELYNRVYGSRLERLQSKLRAIEQGEQPPIAATFAELDNER